MHYLWIPINSPAYSDPISPKAVFGLETPHGILQLLSLDVAVAVRSVSPLEQLISEAGDLPAREHVLTSNRAAVKDEYPSSAGCTIKSVPCRARNSNHANGSAAAVAFG